MRSTGTISILFFLLAAIIAVVLIFWQLNMHREDSETITRNSQEKVALELFDRTRIYTDSREYYRVELPDEWIPIDNEGKRGVQETFRSFESPDFVWSLDNTDGPFSWMVIESGASLSIRALSVLGSAPSDLYDIQEEGIYAIDGLPGRYVIFTEPSTKRGRFAEATVNKDGLEYIFRLSYDPRTMDGKTILKAVLDGFTFLD
ncbi:MAG: hypothetical protein O3B64_02505 [bacterium]|nr:hypothetical protein [bacterium]